jgi:tRNA (guanine37-N1)-methyltransferase
MRIAVVTLFPEMFAALTDFGVSSRAIKKGLLTVNFWNPRDFSNDRHQTIDDRPYGGGPGMVLMIEPLQRAIHAAKAWASTATQAMVIYLSPQGSKLDQMRVAELLRLGEQQNLVLIAGRYEGIDERLIELEVDAEWSIGDYVLSGGELAAMVMLDALIRLLPGALGHKDSAAQDSFSNGLLECPQYTRPAIHEGSTVPSVLLSGNHQRIAAWRLKQSLLQTKRKRPDLLNVAKLTVEQLRLLDKTNLNETNS